MSASKKPESDEEVTGAKREIRLAQIAADLADAGLALDATYAAVSIENVSHCRPPVEDGRIDRLVNEAYSRSLASMRLHRTRYGQDSTVPSLVLLTDKEVVSSQPLGWLIDGILPARSLGVLFGPPGVGKSFIALDMCAHLALGRPWQTRETARCPVVLIATEGVEGLRARVMAAWQYHAVDEIPMMRFVDTPVNLLAPPEVDHLIETLRPLAPGLVVFDTLHMSLVDGDEDSSKDIGRALRNCHRLRRALRTSVLLIHHPTKKGTKTERGSGALKGNIDTMWAAVSGGGTTVVLSSEKQRDAAPFSTMKLQRMTVCLPDGTTSCVIAPDAGGSPAELTPAQRMVVEILRKAGRPMRRTALDAAVLAAPERETIKGLSKSNLNRLLKELMAQGRIEKVETPKGGTVYAAADGSKVPNDSQ